jgi:hypothetical protein
MNSTKYHVTADIAELLLKSVINSDKLGNPKNLNHIIAIFKLTLQESDIDAILHMILSKEDYVPLSIGDYVKVKPPAYHEGHEFEWDVLIDQGLHPGDGYVYGKILNHGNWANIFNPYSQTMEVELFYYDPADSRHIIKAVNYKIDTFSIKKVNKSDIEFFSASRQDPHLGFFEDEIDDTSVDQIAIKNVKSSKISL